MDIWLAILLGATFLITDWLLKLFLKGFGQVISVLIMPFVIIISAVIYCICFMQFFNQNYQAVNKIYSSGLIYFMVIIGISMVRALKPKNVTKDGNPDRRYKGNSLVNESCGLYLFCFIIWTVIVCYLIEWVMGISPLNLFGVMFKVK